GVAKHEGATPSIFGVEHESRLTPEEVARGLPPCAAETTTARRVLHGKHGFTTGGRRTTVWGALWPSRYKPVANAKCSRCSSERDPTRVLQKLEASGELEIKRNGGPKGCHLFRIKMNLTLPLFEGGANLSPDNLTGDKPPQKGVTKSPTRGDTAVSPEPKEP